MKYWFGMHWDGSALRPTKGWANISTARLQKGEQYVVTVQHARSARSHNHYFAVLHEAWMNLPEHMTEQFPTAEHLRKFALIKTGHYHSETFVMTTPSDAVRLAAALRRQKDDFAMVVVTGCAVIRYAAKSQSIAEMGSKDFQKSKQDVIDYLATLVGVTSDQLKAEAGQSA